MDTAIVVFTRDLRLHDNPALHVPELAALDPADIQAPWKLAPISGYPGPIVELS